MLSHGLEQRRLRLGVGPVYLVREHHVREERPGVEGEGARLRIPDAHARKVAREHVGRELHARDACADDTRERAGERRLAHAGHVLEEQVAAREQAHHGEGDGLLAGAQRGGELLGHCVSEPRGGADVGRCGCRRVCGM